MSKSILLVTGLCVLAAGCTTSATPRSTTQRTTLATPATATVTAGVSVTLSTEQAAAVRAYLHAAPQPGRGRNGGLPPGIAKNLARGKALPPGIAKTYLPGHIVTRLPSLPSGLDYIVVAGKLLLVEAATQVIRDVLLDIAFDG